MMLETKKDKKIFVTSPLLPDIEDVYSEIKEIFNSKWLTNMAEKHKKHNNASNF